MLAVYALMQSLSSNYPFPTDFSQVVVGTTRWVAEDPTGDTVGLAEAIGGVPLLATQLNFTPSRYPLLQAYERGYVKEGVGAGGAAIAATMGYQWSQEQLLVAIESLLARWEARDRRSGDGF
jgi:NaMN:DMB phosphoribosyltransferase